MAGPAFRLAVVLTLFLSRVAVAEGPPQTVAEKTDYKETSRHADVIAFAEQLAKQAPSVRLGELGTSGEGRKLPLIILADPPIATAEEARKSGKLVVFAMGNIHAGEVDGKEGLLMLARDLAFAKEKPLKDLVVVIAPIFNADGNERFSKDHRRDQNGPPEVGIRENAQGFDLNRDFVKLESPEVRALVRLFNQWDPALFVDCHTTNGSHHRYPLTYDGPRNPAADPTLVETVRDKMLPEVGKRLEERSGFKSFYYGNFSRDHALWEMYPTQPRYGTQYAGLRNRIGVLSESYDYAPFKTRVLASRDFVRGLFEYVAEHQADIKKLIAPEKPRDPICLRTKMTAAPGTLTVLGYVEDEKDGRTAATDKPRDYTVRLINRAEATLTVPRPYAYLVPASQVSAVKNLQLHGIVLEELREDIELDVEAYRVDKITKSAMPFQKHNQTTVEATVRAQAQKVPAGTILVRTNQNLGTLAAVLLEPMSEDGLTNWNFFDSGLAEGKDFPVLRLPKETPLTVGKVRPPAEERKLNKPINEEAVQGRRGGINLAGNPVTVLGWLDDGEHFLQMKASHLRKVHARSGRSELFYDDAKLRQSLAALPAIDAASVDRLAQPPFARMDPRRTGILVDWQEDLYFARLDGTPTVRLTKTTGAKELATFSPDGKYVAFVRNGNLNVVDLATQAERALTSDGGGNILNGKADWVYGEEIFHRFGRAFWWSPDSKFLAFLRFDDSPVHRFTVVNELPTRQNVELIPYPKAGDPNPLTTLGIVPAAGGEPTFPDLGNYSPTASIFVRVDWQLDSQRLLFFMANRAQTWMDACACGPRGGPVTRLFRETTKAWVDDPGDPVFLKDGSFLLASERTGWRHLYHFDKEGKLLGPVTSGEWEVRAFHVADETEGWIYFSGTRDSHTAPNLYRCKLDGTALARLTTMGDGSHQASVSPKGSLFVDSTSDPATPTQVRLHAADGGLVRTLDTNPVYEREEYRFGKYERVHIKTTDGFTLEGSVLRPPDFDPGYPHPVWFMTYAGPHAPTISETWAGGRLQDQVLASLGFVVFRCDPRSASGKGACSAWTAYRRLGVQELKDIEEAIDWLCTQPGVDAKRIGMSGHSYGGFMTAFALTHSKKFAAGIAGAPVTDWRDYDSIYTERYMDLPQENPEGYDATSVVKAASNLHGKLLLLHGVIDDNVHFQNSVQLVQELQKANKDFEVMFYPASRHGIGGRHYQRLMLDFTKRLLADKSAPAPDRNGRTNPEPPRQKAAPTDTTRPSGP